MDWAERHADLPESHQGLPLVHPETRAEWRAWLEANHDRSTGVWLVGWKKASGEPQLAYEDMVEELLCFGWIDSRANGWDAHRSLLMVTPRQRGSVWSRPNKERVARLEAAGLLAPAGRRVIDAARADGSWTLLDDVEDLIEPPDLAAELDAVPGAREQWDRFPPSARKPILWWVISAKKPETRAKRVAETARLAADGIRAR